MYVVKLTDNSRSSAFFSLPMVGARNPLSSKAPLIISGAAVNFLLLIVLIAFSYLREEPIFWTNEGGWPVWLRDLVRGAYYPMILLELLLLTAFSGVSVHLLTSRCASASVAVVLLPMLWGLFFLVIANSVANNLDNLLHGRPLHWHADATWLQL